MSYAVAPSSALFDAVVAKLSATTLPSRRFAAAD